MEAYHVQDSPSSGGYPDMPVRNARTRATAWVPRRVYYVLRYLRRTLTPGKGHALSNKQIQTAIKFGSEGEVSQIMRWLAGELPTMGRWAYGCLNANPQQYRFIDRERMPSGGYLITLLARPQPLVAPPPRVPDLVQLSFLDDPAVIPHAAHQDAAQGGSFFHDPSGDVDRRQQHAADRRSARDQHKETQKIQNQEEELARTPLFDRLMTQPSMSRSLARRIAQNPPGTSTEFETDLALAETFAKSPFFFTVAKWRDQQRVVAPEESQHDQPARARSSARSRRTTQTHQSGRSAPDHVALDTDYAALLAEIAACNPGMPV